jgi:hypothetical protein
MKKLLIAALLASIAEVTHADTGLYAGAGVVGSRVLDIYRHDEKYPLPETTDIFHINAVAWKAIVGWRPTQALAVEANYIDMGHSSYFWNNGDVSFNGKALLAYGVGFVPLPFPGVDLYGKVGLDHWTLNGRIYYLGRRSDEATQLAWGAGTQVHVARFGIRLEYERLIMAQASRAYLYTLGVTYAFK